MGVERRDQRLYGVTRVTVTINDKSVINCFKKYRYLKYFFKLKVGGVLRIVGGVT